MTKTFTMYLGNNGSYVLRPTMKGDDALPCSMIFTSKRNALKEFINYGDEDDTLVILGHELTYGDVQREWAARFRG